MKCPHCKTEMIIDEWGGWKWTCFHCDYVGKDATDEEIKIHEQLMNTISFVTYDQLRKK